MPLLKHAASISRPGNSVLLQLGLLSITSIPGAAYAACPGTPTTHNATTQTVATFIIKSGLKLLTFVGYSAAEYEDPQTMLQQASQRLDATSPSQTLVNIGATAEGIGAVYELAKSRGFQTIGIVSSLARDQAVPLSSCVDHVFFINDTSWGGRVANTNLLSPTSQAILDNSSAIFGIGGGEVARDEILAARKSGKPVSWMPADLNHKIAIDKARKQGKAKPTDFRGAAAQAF
jgi:hypothetical protein